MLSSGTTLQQERYTIQGLLGQGGFGITYVGVQSGLNRKVAIKEFFLSDYCERKGNTVHATGAKDAGELVGLYRENSSRRPNSSPRWGMFRISFRSTTSSRKTRRPTT